LIAIPRYGATDIHPRCRKIGFGAVAAVRDNRTATAEAGDVVCGVQSCNIHRTGVDSRRLLNRGAVGTVIASGHCRENTCGAYRVHDALEGIGRAAFTGRAGPGIVDGIRGLGRVSLAAVDWIRRNQELEALRVSRGGTIATRVHVAAGNPFCSRSYADLITLSVVANHLADREGAMAVGIDGHWRMVGGGVVPIVVVVHLLAVPATIMRFERRVVPLHSGIGSGNHQTFAMEAQSPDIGCLYFLYVPFHAAGLESRIPP